MSLKEILVKITIRTIFGVALILIVNPLLANAGIAISVGINPISVAASGILGVPGVALLYGIAGCRYL